MTITPATLFGVGTVPEIEVSELVIGVVVMVGTAVVPVVLKQ